MTESRRPIVIALGGNALVRRGEPLTAAVQRRNLAGAARSLAAIARDRRLVVTHGNGPQVGLLALQSAADRSLPDYPLDVLGAESEGMIGYLIEEELRRVLPDREIATLLTQVVVDAADPAFATPSKPIGPVYDEATARRLAEERGWTVGPDGSRWRRLVPSPRPCRIVELVAIRVLVEAGVIVICVGGGGIPVIVARGGLHGVEAVIDKDHAAALLAIELQAATLLLLTDVDAVYADWPTPTERPLRRATPADLRRMVFAAGSMGPKVAAACHFVETTGRPAGIGALRAADELLRGRAGTTVLPATDGGVAAGRAHQQGPVGGVPGGADRAEGGR